MTKALIRFFLIGALVNSAPVFSSQIGFGETRSSAVQSRKGHLSLTLSPQHRLSATYRWARSDLGMQDPNSSSLHLSYMFLSESGSSYMAQAAWSDETYFFKGLGLAAQVDWSLTEQTALVLGGGVARKYYSLAPGEAFVERSLSVGLDHEFVDTWTVGAEIEFKGYIAQGAGATRALNGLSVSATDISSYASFLAGTATSIFLEYEGDLLRTGGGATFETYFLSRERSATLDFFAEAELVENWVVGGFISRGRTEGTSAQTNSYGVSLAYRF